MAKEAKAPRYNLASRWGDILPVYLGIDHDVEEQASRMGVPSTTAMKFGHKPKAIEAAMLAAAMAALRYAGSGDRKAAGFTDKERKGAS